MRGTVPASLGLDAEQRANATAIVDTAVARRLPSRAAVIAVATALQESSLRNLPHGHADSIGLFQQRPSAGWGDPTQLMDPPFAADLFLARLVKVPHWQTRPLTEVAQAVQISAHPDAYARWEPAAAAIVSGLLGRPGAESADPGDVSDRPGLAVFGDDKIRALVQLLPATYLGGPVSVDIDPHHTISSTLTEIGDGETLPGAVVVSASASDTATVKQVRTLVRRVGSERTLYWVMQSPAAARGLDNALRRIAANEAAFHLIEVTDSGGIDLRALLDELALTDAPDPTLTAVSGCDDGLGGYGNVAVSDCSFVLPRANPRTCHDAMRWALAQVDGPAVWYRRCLNFVARAYGYSASGVGTAALYWTRALDARPGDPRPPAGSLVFWDTGQPEGHVALALGNGLVASNDVDGRGTIAVLPLTEVTRRWSAQYLGWAPPFFPNGS